MERRQDGDKYNRRGGGLFLRTEEQKEGFSIQKYYPVNDEWVGYTVPIVVTDYEEYSLLG